MKRPEEIGSLWMGWERRYIHGPRFKSPDTFERLFYRGKDRGYPRYVTGLLRNGKTAIQSVVRPVYPGEDEYLKRIVVWYEGQYIFPALRITPFNSFDGKSYAFYSFAFEKVRLNFLLRHIKPDNLYRVKTRKMAGFTLYLIYKRKKVNTHATVQ